MEFHWEDGVLALVLGLILPGLVAAFFLREPEILPEVTSLSQTEAPCAATSAEEEPVRMRFRREDGTVESRELEDYLVGVVLAEMPAEFEPEALKAQAVVARTYARKAFVTGGKHGDGSVCGDFACCQAYVDPETYLARGNSTSDLEKIRSAVQATAGEVLTYGGELIEATYFSASGGLTEDAAAVWGGEYPYLQATPSPGERAYGQEQVTFSLGELEKMLGLSNLTGNWIGAPSLTPGGGVDRIGLGGKVFTGLELRKLLGLRSTAFTLEQQGDRVIFTTRGYGHRVGMSQYGADAMAVTGSSYRQILAHYYAGTCLEELAEN